MSGADGIIAFVGAMIFMIMVHEYAHYSIAKAFGIRVEEFFLGFGPKLFSIRRGETEFGVKAFFLGGYVRISGMNPWEKVEEADLPRTFGVKPAWQRALVLLAGSLSHFILAIFILFLMFWNVGFEDPALLAGLTGARTPEEIGLEEMPSPTTTLSYVEDRIGGKASPANAAGLKAGDKIVEIEGMPIKTWDDISNSIRSRAGQETTIVVLRGGERRTFEVVPIEAEVPVAGDDTKTEKVGRIGISPTYVPIKNGPARSLWLAVKSTGLLIGGSVASLPKLFGPDGISAVFRAVREPSDARARPVGLVGAGREAARLTAGGQGERLIIFLVFFIVFIGVVNLVPLLPLDGGHLAVVAWEAVFRRKVDMRKLVPVSAVVLAFLLVLFVALLYLDIFRPASLFQ